MEYQDQSPYVDSMENKSMINRLKDMPTGQKVLAVVVIITVIFLIYWIFIRETSEEALHREQAEAAVSYAKANVSLSEIQNLSQEDAAKLLASKAAEYAMSNYQNADAAMLAANIAIQEAIAADQLRQQNAQVSSTV